MPQYPDGWSKRANHIGLFDFQCSWLRFPTYLAAMTLAISKHLFE